VYRLGGVDAEKLMVELAYVVIEKMSFVTIETGRVLIIGMIECIDVEATFGYFATARLAAYESFPQSRRRIAASW
jgi:hypothetical protein